MTDRIYDLFITHAWRYHDDWTRVGEMFDKSPRRHLAEFQRSLVRPCAGPQHRRRQTLGASLARTTNRADLRRDPAVKRLREQERSTMGPSSRWISPASIKSG